MGKGEFRDLKTVQRQIDLIGRHKDPVEVEWMTGKILRNYRGEPDFETIKIINQG
jgi:hypothetical protein